MAPDPEVSAWTPAAVTQLALVLTQLVVALAGAWAIFRTRTEVQQTKADVAVANKQIDGRMSQMFDLVERLTAMIGRMGGAGPMRASDRPRASGEP